MLYCAPVNFCQDFWTVYS